MENKKMSVYYNLRTLEITTIFEGIQSLEGYRDMSLEDASLIYGILIVDFNRFVLRHKKDFKLIKNENEEIQLQLKEESKEYFKEFL